MSGEYEHSPGDWADDEGEEETPQTLRDVYLDAMNQKRPRRPSDDSPPETPRRRGTRSLPRGVPGSAYTYEESEEMGGQGARTSRQAHREALARLRRRPRQPIYARKQEEPPPRTTPPTSRQGRAGSSQLQDEGFSPRHRPQRRDPPDMYPSQPTRAERDSAYAASMHQRDKDAHQRLAEDHDTLRPSSAERGLRAREYARLHNEGGYDEDAPRREDEENARLKSAMRRERTDAWAEDDYETHTLAPRRRGSYRRGSRRRQGGAGSHIFAGCLGGLLTVMIIVAVGAFYLLHNTPLGQTFGKTAYKQRVSQAISLANAGELIIENQVGNITIGVANTNGGGTLTSVRTVYASNSGEADTLLSKMKLSIQQINQGADPACIVDACLQVSATLPPNTSSGLFGTTSSSMDLQLSLPASFNLPDPVSPHIISTNSKAGAIAIDGFNGVLNITGESGNIAITHSLIFASTCVQTMQGDITIGTGSLFDLSQSSNRVPCNNTTSSSDHPWFNVTSGKGSVTIALSTPSTNLLLDANTNNGKISDDFGLNIPSTSDGSASYHGPLLPNSNPSASLYVFTSTGNIAIRKI